jgi:HK97 family phage major capsid protein
VCALGRGRGDVVAAAGYAADRWKDSPQVHATLTDWVTKAATPVGTTTDATWAGPLAAYGIAAEALTILRAQSILGQLDPRLVRVPLHVRIAHETGAGLTGGWIGEGRPIAVGSLAFETVMEDLYKYGTIVPLAQELLDFSIPAAEMTVTRTVLGGLAKGIDTQFLTPSVAAVGGVNPASITNGATAITSSGSTAAQIAADLAAMIAAITTPGAGLTWIMKKKTMATIAAALGAVSGLPATLYGLPVIVSDNSPAQITLVDGAGILYSDSGQFDVSVSKDATLQLDTAPMSPPDATVVMTSLWQQNCVGVRALRWLAWKRIEAGSVVYMAVSY